jgi:rod shape-determining protein MreC
MNNFRTSSFTSYFKIIFNKFSTLLILLFLIGLIFFSKINPNYQLKFNNKIIDFISPTISSIGTFLNYIINIQGEVTEVLKIRDENIILKLDNEVLNFKINQLKQLEQKNTELKELINFVGDNKINFITAKVAISSITPFFHNFIVLAGKIHGVKKGQPVVNYQGLIGRIAEVGENSSRILLITDISSKIPAITENSHERTIIAGNNFDSLEALYLSSENKVKVGELILTTNDGKFFPEGLPIGYITSKKEHVVIIKPVVDVTKLNYVIIINNN